MKAYILIGIAVITVIYVIIKKIWYRSPLLRERKHQTICYDPSDPNLNYTLYYLREHLKQ